ncbi:hypothetical protein [Psychrobacillus sp. FSL K6-1464]|uniref:hypothetical protein n=1 Tax=Psychrobacillus sp. FSL K6-1464 TaxID=2921545 RepID=UPI0030FB9FA9
MEKLTAGRIKECLTGWGFPSVTSEEKWLEDWKIVEERYPNGNQYAFIEHVFHKGKKVFSSRYSPFENDRNIRVHDHAKWETFQNNIYKSHRKAIKRRLGQDFYAGSLPK